MGLFSARCRSTARLDGKTAVITGANSGIGKYTAKDFYERGGRVILACRNVKKGQEAIDEIKSMSFKKPNLGELVVMALDVSSLNSVRSFAENFINSEERLDILVNNAGIMAVPQSKTVDGFEMQFATNHLGHFLLTLLLLPKLCQSTPARIVNVSSYLHTNVSTLPLDDLNCENRPYSGLGAYQESKLENILFTKELARKLKEKNITGVTTYSLHPGLIRTEISRHFSSSYFQGFSWIYQNLLGCFMKSPEQGAQTQIYCSVDEKCANETGLYYAECKTTQPSRLARDDQMAKTLWTKSLEFVGFGPDYNPFINIK